MISTPGQRAPYAGTAGYPHAPNAALLIDFDNVTMGIRSDLGKELKSLLNSEVIRGKVAVQRAYADWRRYPQYIVPLAESSIDLIFAPAYGSSKKNATDLRMAIDAIELVFTRPEIGTFILMTGDSDFSSCVLKLKEYGKYVIGVGMRESSSDLLIQNCDEYYSYHSLSGLTRTGEVQESKEDPWVLMKRAAQQMEANGDVMRTDRLKQVMLDLDPAFDEKKIGYSKFSRFVQEAASKGVVRLRKGENGQYELVNFEGEGEGERPAEAAPPSESRGRGRGRDRDRDRDREGRRDGRRDSRPSREEEEKPEAEVAAEAPTPASEPEPEVAAPAAQPPVEPVAETVAETGAGIDQAYSLLQQAVRDLTSGSTRSVRDGDVKRRMLDLSPGFDESTLGFSKFTRFLRQAHDAEVIDLQRANGGNYEVSLPASGKRLAAPTTRAAAPAAAEVRAEAPAAPVQAAVPSKAEATASSVAAETPSPAGGGASSTRASGGVGALRGRRGGRAGAPEGPPPILPGQVVARTPVEPARAETPTPVSPAAETRPEGEARAEVEEPKKKSRRGRRGRGKARGAEPDAGDAAEQPSVAETSGRPAAEEKPAREEPARPAPPEGPIDKITARARRGRAIRGDADDSLGAPPILPGQAVTPPAAATREPPAESAPAEEAKSPRGRGRGRGRSTAAKEAPATSASDELLAALPTKRDEVIEYLSAYRGVGQKTAEALFDAFGEATFPTLQGDADRVRQVVGDRRSRTVLDQWKADYEARSSTAPAGPSTAEEPKSGGRGRGRPRSSAGSSSSTKDTGTGKTAKAGGKKPEARGGGGRGRKKKESASSS